MTNQTKRRSTGFTQVYNTLLDNSELTMEEKITLIHISSCIKYNNEWRVRQVTCAKLLNTTQPRMSRIFNSLVNKEYLTRTGKGEYSVWKLTPKLNLPTPQSDWE